MRSFPPPAPAGSMTALARAVTLGALNEADAARYNAFLRQGIEQHPDTLRIAVSDLLATPFSTAPGEHGTTLVARAEDDSWLGVVTLEREQGREKRRHVAWVLRMYVTARSSGAGVGRALLRAALARARELTGVAKVNLTVAEHNQRAVSLYASEGFQVIGRETDAFRDPTPRVELTMSLAL